MRSNQKKVSVLTPSYNSERYISRLLDSVLGQTYSNVEMLIIDDGSTDGSAKIIKSYIPRFKKRGYTLKYHYQHNQGQSVAINNGLKMIKGDYLVWPDSDDFYGDTSTIEKMVLALDKSDNSVSTVRVQYNVLNENTMEVMYRWGVDDDTRYKTDLFEEYLFNNVNSTWVVPGGYMVKVDKIDQLIPARDIYTEKSIGQNFQILLPLLYNHKCLTIEEYLYNVVERPDSHSRDVSNLQTRRRGYQKTVMKTLARIPMDASYRKYLLKQYIRLRKPLSTPHDYAFRPRILVKRIIKALLPYGFIVLYKRRHR